MNLLRTLLRLLGAPLAVLLLGLAPAAADVRPVEGWLVAGVQKSVKGIAVAGLASRTAVKPERPAVAAVTASLDVDDDPDQRFWSVHRVQVVLVWRRVPAATGAGYRTALPSARFVAAPPTGPPHA